MLQPTARTEPGDAALWRKWGPYLSDRQWGTVREDYSVDGAAWEYFSHDQARSRAYRWGEDGIAGISDEQQRLCFALALWNGADPILKERYFGLTNGEGNHGEDVKDYYFYLDNTPTHSFMRMLYKYPQRAFPYEQLVRENRDRSRADPEFELVDTGIFDDDAYFDVEVRYAKAGPEDILIEIVTTNRADQPAVLHLLPTLWFRNTWAWSVESTRPSMRIRTDKAIVARHAEMGERILAIERCVPLLFTDNDTNNMRLFGQPNSTGFAKDGINDFVVRGCHDAVNPEQVGTKAAAHHELRIASGQSETIRLRLTDDISTPSGSLFGAAFDATMAACEAEADRFYAGLQPADADEDTRRIIRQALAGMLWSKQFYSFDVQDWMQGHGIDPLDPTSAGTRNAHWWHLLNNDIISMPDKWEYPWYAAWDLAFHALPLALVDVGFAKSQLALMLHENYLHPNGQIPAYEWNFGDVNPPVHAWATLFVYEIEKRRHGRGDLVFLTQSFNKLLMNFTWWLNRKDPTGRNLFEGGFLGLDNIGVFDRSAPMPTGGSLEQADGTAWMALFCQSMLQIALELATHDPAYEDLASQFVQHFYRIASAMHRMGSFHEGLWDEEDGFFYDLLRLPDGSATRLKTRSLVGLLPLCATVVLEREMIDRFPVLMERIDAFARRFPSLVQAVEMPDRPGLRGRRLLTVMNEAKLRRVLARMLDPDEFLSDYGIRSLSKWHRDHPYRFDTGSAEFRVAYEPAESSSGLFGGNSNWRGPVWFPANALLIRALRQLYLYYGDGFTVECPSGSGVNLTLYQVSEEIAKRLASIFRQDREGRRPVFGGTTKFQDDPHWRDCLLFYEYFHGDDGAGLGASHQTGWTGLVATAMVLYGDADVAQFLEQGAQAAVATLAGRDRP